MMIAFHGDPAVKTYYLERVRAHRAADEIVHGTYWENGRGCAVGCSVHSNNHGAYEREMGIPCAIARLEDTIFENLPDPAALDWPIRFLECIPVGADLSQVSDKFLLWLLVNPQHGVIRFAPPDGRVPIQRVADLFERRLGGHAVRLDEWTTARQAAYAAAAPADAAYGAADAAAAYGAAYTYKAAAAAYEAAAAAYAAGEAHAAAAAYAAVAYAAAAYAAAADAAYAAAAARQGHYQIMADKLVDLLAAAPIRTGES